MKNKKHKMMMHRLHYICVVVLLLAAAGCATPQAQKPSDAAASPVVSQAQDTPVPMNQNLGNPDGRHWPEQTAHFQNIGVAHPSLYMQDIFEEKGGNDVKFNTWDWESLLSATGSPFIFAGNVVKLPVDATINPPWKMQSDRAGYPLQSPVYELPAEPTGMAAQGTEKYKHDEYSVTCSQQNENINPDENKQP
jgi:hypothetical protein